MVKHKKYWYRRIKGKRVRKKVMSFYSSKKRRKSKNSKYIAGAVAAKIRKYRTGKKVKFNYKGKNRVKR